MDRGRRHTLRRVRSTLLQLIDDAEEALQQTAEQAQDGIADWHVRLQKSVADAQDTLAALPQSAMERARAAGKSADGCVHDNPWKAVAVTAGVGVLVGMLISRR